MNYADHIELDNIELKDCIELAEKKNLHIIANDGHIENLIKEDESYT